MSDDERYLSFIGDVPIKTKTPMPFSGRPEREITYPTIDNAQLVEETHKILHDIATLSNKTPDDARDKMVEHLAHAVCEWSKAPENEGKHGVMLGAVATALAHAPYEEYQSDLENLDVMALLYDPLGARALLDSDYRLLGQISNALQRWQKEAPDHNHAAALARAVSEVITPSMTRGQHTTLDVD